MFLSSAEPKIRTMWPKKTKTRLPESILYILSEIIYIPYNYDIEITYSHTLSCNLVVRYASCNGERIGLMNENVLVIYVCQVNITTETQKLEGLSPA